MEKAKPEDALLAKLERADAGQLDSPGAAMGAPGDAAAVTGPGPVTVDESQLWIGAAIRYGGIGRAMVPERAQPYWTEERLAEVGKELAACAKHYGWKFGGWLTHPLAGLAVVSVPLVWPIVEPHAMPYLRSALQGLRPASPAPASPPDPAPPETASGSSDVPPEKMH